MRFLYYFWLGGIGSWGSSSWYWNFCISWFVSLCFFLFYKKKDIVNYYNYDNYVDNDIYCYCYRSWKGKVGDSKISRIYLIFKSEIKIMCVYNENCNCNGLNYKNMIEIFRIL